MGYSLKRVDGSNITLHEAREITRLRIAGFSTDIIQQVLIPKQYRLDPEQIPPIVEFEALKKKVQLFENRYKVGGLRTYIDLIANPLEVNWLLVEDETKKIVGTAAWRFPTYTTDLPPTYVLLWRKLQALVLRLYLGVYRLFHPINSMDELFDEFRIASEHSGLKLGKPHTLESLQKLDRKQLEEIVYPKEFSYYLAVITVSSQVQGKGLGKQLMQGSLAEVAKVARPPPGVDGPAKLSWQAAPAARTFYQKLGYRAGPAFKSERGFDHAVFFDNVD